MAANNTNTNNNNINNNYLINGNDSDQSDDQMSEPVPTLVPQSPPQLSPKTKCVAQAVLVCEHSQPLAERRVALDCAVKVGRAVGRSKPSADNFVFDCKVLSRNHALLVFENQKFFLQDTSSSNGTFINSQRLSPANEESTPREVFSGDVVQFGVDVVQFGVDNTRKVTHGCITAKIKLYYPDGTEARPQEKHLNSAQPTNQNSVCITSQQLYELSQYLSEAIHREQILENKLETLQRVVTSAHESANTGWKSLVEEDRLLSRIETLQNKLEICLNSSTQPASSQANNKESVDSTDSSADKLQYVREEMLKLIEDKEKYESAAKEAIQKALEEKLIVLTKVHEFEVSVKSQEEECARLQDVCETSAQEINRLANCNDDLNKEIESYGQRLKQFETQKVALIDATNKEREELEERVRELRQKEAENQELIAELRAINDSANVTVEQLRRQLEELKRSSNVIIDGNSCENNNFVNESEDKSSDNTYSKTNNTNNNDSNGIEIEVNLSEELFKVRKQLELSQCKCNELTVELDGIKQQSLSSITLTGSGTKSMIECSKSALINGEILSTNNDSSSDDVVVASDSVRPSEDIPSKPSAQPTDQTTSQLSAEINVLKELLAETRAAKKSIEEELTTTVTELENLRSVTKQLSKESYESQQKFEKTCAEMAEKGVLIQSLKSQISDFSEKMRNCLKESEQIRQKIMENEKHLSLKDEEISSLRVLLEEERKVQHKYASNYELCRKQLSEQQLAAKQSQTEAELLRKKVYSCNEELRQSRTNLSVGSGDLTPAPSKECERLETECQSLRGSLVLRETELQTYQRQNGKLETDYRSLQNAFELLQKLNSELELRGDTYWREQFDLAKADADSHQAQLITIREQLEELKTKLMDCSKDNALLNEELTTAKEDYEIFSYQSKIATACAFIPLFMLLIAVLFAYYPSVSTVTGTTDL